MDRRAAIEIVPMLVRASQEAADTVDVYWRYASDREVKAFSEAIGAIVAAHYQVLRGILNEHPDLDPGGLTPSEQAR